MKSIHTIFASFCLWLAAQGLTQPLQAADSPERVGSYGNPHTLHIVGAETFPPGKIRMALARTPDFVMASHPESEFEKFLSVTQSCLERGYRLAGFSDPSIKMSWDAESSRVVVTIKEGPRSRMGEIRFEYEESLSKGEQSRIREEDLRVVLVGTEDLQWNETIRANFAVQKISQEKQLRRPKAERPEQDDFLLSSFSDPEPGKNRSTWRKGDWIDFNPAFIALIKSTVGSFLAKEGYFGAEVEVVFRENPGAPGTSDLVIRILSVGRILTLGKVAVSGQRLNTSEEVLDFLGLKEGMVLRGPWLSGLEEALCRSGRFLGWSVAPKLAPDERPGEIDLSIALEELWCAPPLSSDLAPEQTALLKAVDWFNSEAGLTEDIVLTLALDHPSGPVSLEVIANLGSLVVSISGLDHELTFLVEEAEELTFFASSSREGSFFASLPVHRSHLQLFFSLLRKPQESPFGKSGSINFGAGLSSLSAEPSELLIDPACAFDMGEIFPVIEGDKLVLLLSPLRLSFDLKSGRLLGAEVEGNSHLLLDPGILKMEAGAVEKARKQLKENARGTTNWLDDKEGASLVFYSMFFGWELLQGFGEDHAPELSALEFTSRISERVRRWEPLSAFLGDAVAALAESIGAGGKAADDFTIPFEAATIDETLRFGWVTSTLVGMGVFDLIARESEPGSWPEKVLREISTMMDGNSGHFDEVRKTLLEDEKMGPVGSVLCAGLLSKIGHPGASGFLAKAEAEMNEKGFEKDWSIFLSGPQGADGLAWKLLKALQRLDGPEIDRLFPGRKEIVRELALKVAEVVPGQKAAIMRPSMNALWEDGVRDLLRQTISSIRREMNAKWDPAKVAAVVNGRPLLRPAVTLAELELREQPDPLGMNGRDKAIASLLVAEQLWKGGRGPQNEMVDQIAKGLVEKFGGWAELEKMGFTRESFDYWTAVSISEAFQMRQMLQGNQIKEKEAREFFERSPLQLRQLIHLHSITLKVEDNLEEQQKKAGEIRKRILESKKADFFNAGDLEEAFGREAGLHSEDAFRERKGCNGWIDESTLPEQVSLELATLAKGGISEVVTVRGGGKTFVRLFYLPDDRKPIPFENLRAQSYRGAYLDKLFAQAQIDIIHQGPKAKEDLPENKALGNLGKAFDGFFSRMEGGDPGDDGKEEEEKDPFEKFPLPDRVIRGAAAGRAEDLYLLGTYAEREVSPVKNGLEEAIRLYRDSAEKGGVKAMLRLSELHRIGRGVERDAGQSLEWRDRAAKALADKAEANQKAE